MATCCMYAGNGGPTKLDGYFPMPTSMEMALPVPTKTFLPRSSDMAMLFAPSGCTHPPPPAAPFVLSQNLCVCLCVCVRMHTHVCVCARMHIHVCVCVRMHIHVCACIYRKLRIIRVGNVSLKIFVAHPDNEKFLTRNIFNTCTFATPRNSSDLAWRSSKQSVVFEATMCTKKYGRQQLEKC